MPSPKALDGNATIRPSGQMTSRPGAPITDRGAGRRRRRAASSVATVAAMCVAFAALHYGLGAVRDAFRSDPCRAACAIGPWPGHPDPCGEEKAWLASLPGCQR